MKNIFDHLAEIIPTMHGWGEVEKAQRMAAMVIALNAETSAEIGVYAGRSFLGLSMGHAYIAKGTAHAIDPWTNEAAAAGYEGANETFWKGLPLEVIYQCFVKSLEQTESNHRVVIHRKKSDDVEPPKIIDILSVDGSHTEQAVTDVKRFAANVRIGGVCFMDDEGWQNGNDKPVQRAVKELTGLGFIRLYTLGTGGVYQRIK